MVTVRARWQEADFSWNPVAKLAKSFGLNMSLTENLGDFRYKLRTFAENVRPA